MTEVIESVLIRFRVFTVTLRFFFSNRFHSQFGYIKGELI